MNISIFGLGYVGCVSLGCLAKNGHHVIGVDVNKLKVNLINEGKSTIIEKDIDTIIKEQRENNNISATLDHKFAVSNSDVTIICVGTPSTNNGHLNLEYIYQTANQIGEALKEKESFHVIVIRSTVLPGTNNKAGEIIAEVSGKKRNIGFAVVSNPEFLREGSAVEDYYNPAITVLGSDCNKAIKIMESMYADIKAPIVNTDIEVAEIIKYVNNTFHALKICFANEIGNICKKMNIDSHEVMDIFCKDTHLNISPYYFKPGFAYGGSCLPKDMKALKTISHDSYLSSPLIEAIHNSNENQKRIVIDMIESTGGKKIGILGLSFKKGTDDLRYSPAVDIVEYLFGKGYNILIWDEIVQQSKLVGSNKEFIQQRIPHLSKLITDSVIEVIEKSEIIIITQKNKKISSLIEKYPEKVFIDVVRVIEKSSSGNYQGICW